jgi:hypothetical protein
MRNLVVAAGDVLTLQLAGRKGLRARCREVYEALNDCAAYVNWRRIEAGHRPIVALSYD